MMQNIENVLEMIFTNPQDAQKEVVWRLKAIDDEVLPVTVARAMEALASFDFLVTKGGTPLIGRAKGAVLATTTYNKVA